MKGVRHRRQSLEQQMQHYWQVAKAADAEATARGLGMQAPCEGEAQEGERNGAMDERVLSRQEEEDARGQEAAGGKLGEAEARAAGRGDATKVMEVVEEAMLLPSEIAARKNRTEEEKEAEAAAEEAAAAEAEDIRLIAELSANVEQLAAKFASEIDKQVRESTKSAGVGLLLRSRRVKRAHMKGTKATADTTLMGEKDGDAAGRETHAGETNATAEMISGSWSKSMMLEQRIQAREVQLVRMCRWGGGIRSRVTCL